MSSPFVAEIRIFAGNFAPTGWALCNGQIMPISQNTALFSLLGTTYGGDGKSNFALPNLQGASPMQQGQGPGLSLRDLGETSGEAAVTLLQTELPAHNHGAQGTTIHATATVAQNEVWAAAPSRGENLYSDVTAGAVAMSAGAFSPAGGSLPHNNMPPYLVLNFIIALQGVFPARS